MKSADDLLVIGVAIRELDNQSMVDRLARAAADARGEAVGFVCGKFAAHGIVTHNLNPYSERMLRLRQVSATIDDCSYLYHGCVLIALHHLLIESREERLAVLGPRGDGVSALRKGIRTEAARLALAAWLSGAALGLSTRTWEAAILAGDLSLDI